MRKSFYLSLVLTAAVLGGLFLFKGKQEAQVLGLQTTSLKENFLRGLREFTFKKSSTESATLRQKQPVTQANFEMQLKEIDTLMNNAQKIDFESDPTVGL